ncbi:MAG: DMT family transporter, partial [Candidatus Portnoybacteria bacterium]|nr:DMT family transporter [Candidatus Portnoybacteria bacterium]
GMLGGLAVFLIPFGVKILPANLIFLSLASGALFVLALYFFFSALKISEASRIPALVGSLSPIIIFILSYVFLEERLLGHELYAFILLLFGGVLISVEKSKTSSGYAFRGFFKSLLAALFFSSSFVIARYIFVNSDFISGFVWTRLGGVLMAFFYLSSTSFRRSLITPRRSQKRSTPLILFAGQGLGALGFVAINYGISLKSVTLVNALQSVQYIFLFAAILLLSFFYPRIIRERISKGIIVQKLISLFLIGLGIFYLR